MPTNFTTFTLLTWWHGKENGQERAIISVTKDGSFSTGVHLHRGCTDAESEICLTYANREDIFPIRMLSTDSENLNTTSSPNWKYFGVTYQIPPKGKVMKGSFFARST